MLRTQTRARALRAVGALLAAVGTATLAGPPIWATGTQTNTNACLMDANALYSDMDVTVGGTALASSPTSIQLTALSVAIDIPEAVHLELYSYGYYDIGFNPVGVTASLTIAGGATVEGQQTVAGTTMAQVQISDPDGVTGTGDEAATISPAIQVPLPDTAWTPTGGDVQFSESAAQIVTSHFFGAVTATSDCVPGTSPDRISVLPALPIPFEVVTPPSPPSCSGSSSIGGPGQAVEVDVTALCADVNGDLDPSTLSIVTGPAGGTASASPYGVLIYTNTDPAIGTDEMVVTIADARGLVSAPITITIRVQSLRLVEQSDRLVTLPSVTLDGAAHVAVGALNSITVTNLSTSGLGFTVSAYATDLGAPEVPTTMLDADGDGTSEIAVPSCAAAGLTQRRCIPAGNMGWAPRAEVVVDGVDGGGAAVQAGQTSAASPADWMQQLQSDAPTDGLSQPQILCSAPPAAAIGTFRCDADLFLGVPASAGASRYSGLIVITII